jgi:cell division protein FtsB
MAMHSGRREMLVRIFWRRLSIVGLFFLLIVVGWGVWRAYGKERESGLLRAQAEAKLAELRAQEENLRARIDRLETDRGKEEAIRSHYDVGKEGEGLIVIVEPETAEPVQASSTVRQWVQKFLPFW